MELERPMSFRGVRGSRKTNILRVNTWYVSFHSLSSRRVASAIPFLWHWNICKVYVRKGCLQDGVYLFARRAKCLIRKNLSWVSFPKRNDRCSLIDTSVVSLSLSFLYLQLSEGLRFTRDGYINSWDNVYFYKRSISQIAFPDLYSYRQITTREMRWM